MEMEMGLKLTRPANGFSSTEFQFAKDRGGPLFQSTEKDTMFILTVHLKGYMQDDIKVDINEEGTIITIRGEKLVQETVMVRCKFIKKDVEIKKFSKAFKIPDGVILDKIKARFDEDNSTLTLKMPKKVKGILGTEFVEVKENQDLPIVSDKNSKKVTFKEDMDKPKAEENQEKEKVLESLQKPREVVEKHVVKDELMSNVDSNIQNNDTIQEIREPHGDFVARDEPKDDQVSETTRKNEDDNVPKRSSKICVPIVAGSALILSLVVFVIHLIRTKNQSGKRKD